jgi:agmatine/peptidylarginine deiminase
VVWPSGDQKTKNGQTLTSIARATVSDDGWWIADSGTIQVNCSGVYSPNAFGFRLWIGTATYAGTSDLHMILGPNHPTTY